MIALPHQFIDHDHQRRIFSFEIRRQKADYAPVIRRPVKLPPGSKKALMVQGNIFYKMPAVDGMRGAAAFKHRLRLETGAAYGMRLEKTDGQKGYIRYGIYPCPNSANRFCVLLVYGIVEILKIEYFQGKAFETNLIH